MSRFLVIFILFFGIFLWADSKADSKGVDSKQTSEKWRNLKTLQGDFKQEIKGERGAIPVLYSGKIYAANNKVRWQYTTPLKKEVYIEKNAAYIYEPELNQVTISTLSENVDFITILNNVKKIKENAYQTQIGETIYYLTIKDSKPHTLKYKDNLENDITILFDNIILNNNIDETIFTFTPPDDVEYIDAN